MRRIIAFPLFAAALIFFNCEKDDICEDATPKTPRLVISFYDLADPTLPKNVTQLAVLGDGLSNPVGVFNGVSTISIPLKTSELVTRYNLIFNSNDANLDNWDTLEFNYATNDIYISRACGFKTLFTLNETTPIVHTDFSTPDGLWIQNISVNQPYIQNEDETHVNIYF